MSKELYQYEFEKMEFSKDGQLDELIALDRYVISEFDGYQVGDTVVAIIDKAMGTKRVGVIEDVFVNGDYKVKDRFGETHTVTKELLQKPLELKPSQLWDRWAKGGASVEKLDLQNYWENEFRWLFDGFRYSLGGRIQLMLGQEFVTGKKANLTSYNCFVIKSPRGKDTPKEQFAEIVDTAHYEANIMRRGGGVGMNISLMNTVEGSGRKKSYFNLLLPTSHKDVEELHDRQKLGKFDAVTVIHDLDGEAMENGVTYVKVGDSVEELFEALRKMVTYSFDETSEKLVLDFSDVRHRNAIVKGVNGRSSGAVSWMELFVLLADLLQKEMIDNVEFAEIYSAIVHLIIQGGSRRGALMLICNDDNQNVRKFIERKKTFGYLSGANISVGVSDVFMAEVKRAKAGSNDEKDQLSLDLWNLIIQSAWQSAEPGIVWLERYNKMSNSYYYPEGLVVATNPLSA